MGLQDDPDEFSRLETTLLEPLTVLLGMCKCPVGNMADSKGQKIQPLDVVKAVVS